MVGVTTEIRVTNFGPKVTVSGATTARRKPEKTCPLPSEGHGPDVNTLTGGFQTPELGESILLFVVVVLSPPICGLLQPQEEHTNPHLSLRSGGCLTRHPS